MEAFLKLIQIQSPGHRQVTEKTAKTYAYNLNNISKLCTGENYSNPEFLKDYDAVIAKLEEKQYAISTLKVYLAIISVVLSPQKRGVYLSGFEEVGSKYVKLLKDKKEQLDKHLEKQELSKKDSTNWCSMKDLIAIRNKYGLMLKNKFINLGPTGRAVSPETTSGEIKELLQKYVISSLYTLDWTNRNVYGNMEIVTRDEYDTAFPDNRMAFLQKNYLVVDQNIKPQVKFFSIGDSKTSWKRVVVDGVLNKKKWCGETIIPIGKEMNRVINLWLRYHPQGPTELCAGPQWFLFNTRSLSKPLGTTGITKLLNKTFKETGKKVSSAIIRKIKNTQHFGKDTSILEKKNIAMKSGHSVAVQQTHYVKYIKDDDCPFCGFECVCGANEGF